ncbi:MAG: DUF192 domain-containing protein [Proteocatella sp.]
MMMKLNGASGVSMQNVIVADGFWTRFLGLMGRKNMPKDSGLILMNCSSIHTFFMRFDINVVYLSKDFKVLGVQTIKPWRFGKFIRGVNHVLEVSSGSNVFENGDIISMEEMGQE